ncbi:MAG: HAD-IA family hydrolase [Pseudomonadota bacterium]
MSNLHALIFDVDGTLADTESEGHRPAFNAAFRELDLGWEWSIPLYGELLAIAGGKERIYHYLERFHTEYLGEGGEAFIADLHHRKTRHYLSRLTQGGIPFRPGVRRLLTEARAAGLTLAIATTTTPENVTGLIIANLGPEAVGWFKVIAAGDVVAAKKPAPDIYRHVLKSLALDPWQCVAFEDTEQGLTAAKGAGIDCVVVTVNGYTARQDFQTATLVLDHLGDASTGCRRLAGAAFAADHLTDLPLLVWPNINKYIFKSMHCDNLTAWSVPM